ncbi:MAG: HAMP domain-containing protein [Deltaproteobacteria bacterium]|nr:HAMP domain-containing protein [Deltaproteobacteria bacterium]
MRFKSLKSKLLLAVSVFVIVSGLVIAFWVSHRYSAALRKAMVGQAENVAHSVALDAADRILINDLVSLQKMLDQQTRSNPAVGYLFVLKDGLVLAHTFEQGVPGDLITANELASHDQPRFRRIVSTQGEHYLDAAYPIFEGKVGVLRLGFSESLYRRQVAGLWGEIGLFTLAILCLALAVSLWFIRRITRPLAALVQATREIDQGASQVRVPVSGQDEIATLASSFNQMVERQEEYTHRLEEQSLELERAHSQTVAACRVVQEISALRTLEEMAPILLTKLRDSLLCRHILLVVFNSSRDTLFVISGAGIKEFHDPKILEGIHEVLAGIKKLSFSRKKPFKPPLTPEDFPAAERQAIIPLDHRQVEGAAVIACPAKCACHLDEIERVGLILNQAAGALRRAILHAEEVGRLQAKVNTAQGFGEIIGKDPKMQMVYKLIEDVAASDATILIQGESGTGKELAARAIHRLSPRQAKPFVVINCSAYPATLLESELFGHEKGAFTGALRQKAGRFEQAHGGTVFLDEVGEIPLPAQIKLLRVLQTRKFERLGGVQTLTVDVRILAATNKDLLQEVRKGNFREDLYYRLNVIPMMLPLLRERQNDIPLLALHFLRGFARERRKDLREFSSDAMRLLLNYPWPGNVRELENSVEHAAVLAKGGQVEAWDLPSALRLSGAPTAPTMAEREVAVLLQVLEECGGNKKLAAQRLGISRSTVYAILKKHNLLKSHTITH